MTLKIKSFKLKNLVELPESRFLVQKSEYALEVHGLQLPLIPQYKTSIPKHPISVVVPLTRSGPKQHYIDSQNKALTGPITNV